MEEKIVMNLCLHFSIDRCEDSTHCELHLEFYSNQHVLIEVIMCLI